MSYSDRFPLQNGQLLREQRVTELPPLQGVPVWGRNPSFRQFGLRRESLDFRERDLVFWGESPLDPPKAVVGARYHCSEPG